MITMLQSLSFSNKMLHRSTFLMPVLKISLNSTLMRHLSSTQQLSPQPALPQRTGGRHTVSFIGAPVNLGQRLSGASAGPHALREYGNLETSATAMGWRWSDRGDVGVSTTSSSTGSTGSGDDSIAAVAVGTPRNAAEVGDACAAIFNECKAAALAGDFVLCVGGDHSAAAGSVAAALKVRPDVGVVWVDAHADLNSPHSSPSGNMHGMPVSLLLGRCGPPAAFGRAWNWLLGPGSPRLSPRALVYVGLRDLDAGEVIAIRELGVLAFTMADVDRLGIAKVAKAVEKHLKGRPIHLSFDVDAVDPSVITATGTPSPGGLSYREAHYLCEELAATRRLCSMDLVEVNPELGLGGVCGKVTVAGANTARAAASFVLSALGKTTLPPIEKGTKNNNNNNSSSSSV